MAHRGQVGWDLQLAGPCNCSSIGIQPTWSNAVSETITQQPIYMGSYMGRHRGIRNVHYKLAEDKLYDIAFLTIQLRSCALVGLSAPGSVCPPIVDMTEDEHTEQQAAASAPAEESPAAVEPNSDDAAAEQEAGGKAKNKKVLSEKKLKRIKEAHEKRGIVYVSRIPPHMKPQKLRHLLSQYGEIGRVYCTPEGKAARQNRKKKGGNSGEPLCH